MEEIARPLRRGRDVVVEAGPHPPHPQDIIRTATVRLDSSLKAIQSLVIVPDAPGVRQLQSVGKRSGLHSVYLGITDDTRSEARTVADGPALVVSTPQRLIDHIRRGNADLSHVTTCTVAAPDECPAAEFVADLHYVYTKFDRQPATVLFAGAQTDALETIDDLVRRPVIVSREPTDATKSDPQQESSTMAKRDLPFDADSLARQLKEIVRRIHEDENAREMNQYKRFVKRNVSIFSRAYFTAYLVKQLAGGGGIPSGAPAGGRSSRGSSGGASTATSANRTSIFVSAGRNRRVHAKDLLTLFTSPDGIVRDDIGQIKVLDNYSFVEVETSKADQVIEALNGSEFRGRKLTVNFARKK